MSSRYCNSQVMESNTSLEPKASLVGPVMSIAGIAGLKSLMGSETNSMTTAAMAAAVAAGEGYKYYNDTVIAQKALDQTKTVYDCEKKQAEQLHEEELEREAEQHLQDMTNQLRESQKEADRDLWEQQNTEKQNSMTVAALFLAGAFALAVEGQLPSETGGLLLCPSIPLKDAYYICLAACIALLFISISSGMFVVQRMASFMLSRTAKQQETLRQLRELANRQLRDLQNNGMQNHNSSKRRKSRLRLNNEKINNKRRHLHECLQKARQDFSKHLWEQPVLVMGWMPIGSGRHVASFQEWYFYDKVSKMSDLNSSALKAGAILLILSLCLYEEGQLLSDEYKQSQFATILFWALSSLGIASFLYLLFVEIRFPTPNWRNTVAETISNDGKEIPFEMYGSTLFDSQELFPSRRDPILRRNSLSQGHYKLDKSSLSLLLKPLRSFAYNSRLETVNVEEIKIKGEDLFDAMDVSNTKSLSSKDLCQALGLNLQIIYGDSDIITSRELNELRISDNSDTTSDIENSIQESYEKQIPFEVGKILRKHSILQEALVKLLDRKVREHDQFMDLERHDPEVAERYLVNMREHLMTTMQAIENGVEPSLKQSAACRSWRRRQQNEGKLLHFEITRREWKGIMQEIFHQKFF